MHTETLVYNDDETTFCGYVAYDEKVTHKRPLILIGHDWSGCNDFAKEKAEKLAELGFIGFAMDVYGEGKTAETKEAKQALMMPLAEDRGLLRKRLQAAYAKALTITHTDSNKIAAIGFCFGGLCALDLARSGLNIKGVVSFHGLLHAPSNLPSALISAKVLAMHGYDDPLVTPDVTQQFATEMTKAGVDWQLTMYGHTKHAFTNPLANDPSFGTVYDARADRRSWLAMQNFFAEIFA